MPSFTVGEVVDLVGGSHTGDRARPLRGVRSLTEAKADDVSFLANPRYQHLLATTRAGAVLVNHDTPGENGDWIRVGDPYFALAQILQRWFAEIPGPSGISPLASISKTAKLGSDVRVGPFVTIADDVVIGDRVTIFQGTSIEAGCTIGDDTLIHANVALYRRTQIGRRCILHSAVVVGADGYGFATHEGKHFKIPQIGIVRIEDDVELGAGTTVDRAALGETVIGEGTKVDNLVQIAHNVKIGRHCLIVSQVGIAGSTEIGDYCVFGGQAGAAGHLRIGSRVMVGAKSAVMKNWDGPAKIAGQPARLLRDHLRTEALIRRLPEMLSRIDSLEKHAGFAHSDSRSDEEKE